MSHADPHPASPVHAVPSGGPVVLYLDDGDPIPCRDIHQATQFGRLWTALHATPGRDLGTNVTWHAYAIPADGGPLVLVARGGTPSPRS